jgi:hypothetical protein
MQAMRLASANGIDVVLGDRDIEITLGRLNGNDNGSSKTAVIDTDHSSVINEVRTHTDCLTPSVHSIGIAMLAMCSGGSIRESAVPVV